MHEIKGGAWSFGAVRKRKIPVPENRDFLFLKLAFLPRTVLSVCSGEALFADPDEEVRVIQRDEQIHEDAVFFVHVIIRGALVKGLAVLEDEADALQIGHIGIVFGDSVIVHIKFATVVVALGIIAVAVDGIQALGAGDHW